MKKLIDKYTGMSAEKKIVFNTTVGLCFSALLATGKLFLGIFNDFDLCIVAMYTFAMLFAKLQCLIGIKENTNARKRNTIVALSLLTSSIVYIAFMARLFFVQRTPSTYTLNYVVLLAFIAFAELGFAVAGMIRTKRKGLYYRNIKIANMGMALIAILTTQMSLLDFTETKNTDIYNAFSGIAVGLFIALSALYVFFAPKISLVGRESNVFVGEGTQTVATDGQGNVKILLVSSRVYGSYVYVAKLDEKTLSGEIRQEASLWKKMHVALKILCCVLSEILIFVWLAGYLVFFLRCINLPAQLERKMKTLNFSKTDLQKTISTQCEIAETPDM